MPQRILRSSAVLSLALAACVAFKDYQKLQVPDVYESNCARYRRIASTKIHSNARPCPPGPFKVELNVTVGRFQSDFISFNTRAYNGKLPAPTIKVCVGDELIISLTNTLGNGDVNITNLHTHGLDASPEDHHDNVMAPVMPGESREYRYQILAEQAEGTNWYHPHHHGTVNSQLSGMMAGMLVVVDNIFAPDFPPELIAMDDVPVILQGVCYQNCINIRDTILYALVNRYSKDTVQTATDMNIDMQFNASKLPLKDPSFLHVFVNGQIQPKMDIFRNEYKRLRFLNAIPNNNAEIVLSGCDMYLIAMDGVYRRNGPLLRHIVIIPAGGRADIIISCPQLGEYSVMGDSIEALNPLLGMTNDHRIPRQILLVLQVIEPKAQNGAVAFTLPRSLPQAAINRVDLMYEHIAPHNRFVNEFTTTAVPLPDDPNKTKDVYAVNHKVYDEKSISHTMQVGSVQEWLLSSNNYGVNCTQTNESTPQCKRRTHPFHLHAVHVQVVAKQPGFDVHNLLFEVGEWRDTLPVYQAAIMITVRFIPKHYMIGQVIAHCHIASHADQGMATLLRVIE